MTSLRRDEWHRLRVLEARVRLFAVTFAGVFLFGLLMIPIENWLKARWERVHLVLAVTWALFFLSFGLVLVFTLALEALFRCPRCRNRYFWAKGSKHLPGKLDLNSKQCMHCGLALWSVAGDTDGENVRPIP
jgi:hypothetical protein